MCLSIRPDGKAVFKEAPIVDRCVFEVICPILAESAAISSINSEAIERDETQQSWIASASARFGSNNRF